MVIVLEGLPCSGKTTIARYLAKSFKARLIAELPSRHFSKGKKRKKFYLNDLRKSRNAQMGRIIILDRYFLSTIAFEEAFRIVFLNKKIKNFNISLYDFQDFDAKNLYHQFLQKRVLVLPSFVFYIKISPKESLKRRLTREKKAYSNLDPWLNLRFLESFQNYCLKNICSLYKIKPVIINGALPQETIFAIIKKSLNKLK